MLYPGSVVPLAMFGTYVLRLQIRLQTRLRILLNLNAKQTASTHIRSALVPLKQHYDRE